MTTYKSMYKYELAAAAGVSRRTLCNWLHSRKKELKRLGVLPTAKLLPPAAVKYICENFCIDLD